MTQLLEIQSLNILYFYKSCFINCCIISFSYLSLLTLAPFSFISNIEISFSKNYFPNFLPTRLVFVRNFIIILTCLLFQVNLE